MTKILVLSILIFSAVTRAEEPTQAKNYFELLMGYMPVNNFQSGLQDIAYTQNSTDAYNISVRYIHILYKGLDLGVDANFETNRSFPSYTTQGTTIPYLTPVPNLSFFYGRGLLAFNYYDFYIFGAGGLSYPLALNFPSNLSSGLVMGGGLGYRPSDTFLFEIEYRQLDFRGVDRVSGVANDYFKQSGILVKFGYAFR